MFGKFGDKLQDAAYAAKHKAHSLFKGAAEQVMPTLKDSGFTDRGVSGIDALPSGLLILRNLGSTQGGSLPGLVLRVDHPV